MVRNGASDVNLVRAEFSPSVVSSDEMVTEHPANVWTQTAAGDAAPLSEPTTKPQKEPVASEGLVSVFVEFGDDSYRPVSDAPPDREQDRRRAAALEGCEHVVMVRDLATADVPIERLDDLASHPDIAYLQTGESVKRPRPESHFGAEEPNSVYKSIATLADDIGADEGILEKVNGGENVLIGIIDVGGFDFAHPDFRGPDGGSRFVAIWDQGGQGPGAPAEFGYGRVIDKDRIAAGLDPTITGGLSPTSYEPQSQMERGSHGTHVASIAAGNHGLCPNADIAGVLVSLAADDSDRRRSFYDSTRIAHAVAYLFDLAEQADYKAVVVNISLGTNGHAHDASSPTSRWIDALLSRSGRALCVAAGNAGQTAPLSADDIGYIVGRIHHQGRVPASGLVSELEWEVVGNQISDISENELEIWYPAQDRFSVRVKPPELPWLEWAEPRQYYENHQLPDGSFVSVYNESHHPANGDNYINVFLSPFLSPDAIVGVRAGTWRVQIRGDEVRDGVYHAWIERDDPIQPDPTREDLLFFPSFFGNTTYADQGMVSSLACGQRIISVANLDRESGFVNKTSSKGPTRDGRAKPDVAAPGTAIVAANGFQASEHDLWVAKTGTSMASPYVTGLVGLMLAANPGLTAAQVGGVIRRAAVPLPGKSYEWDSAAGFGAIQPIECIRQAVALDTYQDIGDQE